MPKIIETEEFENEDEDETVFEEDLELEEAPAKKSFKRPAQAPSPARVGLPRNIQPPQPVPPKRRYGIVAAQPVQIVDVEAKEVVAEGEYLIAQALADIIERLERIENTIGSMTQ